MRVLLVDDEPIVLAALTRMLRRVQPDISVVPTSSGRTAMDLLRAERFDVLITDMQMPIVTGEEVLACARETHPETVRVVLSGHAEAQARFRVVSLAHRYLAKPCTVPELRETLRRARDSRGELGDADVLVAVAGGTTLPPAPRLYTRLMRVLASGDPSIPAIAAIIQEDDALTAKVLQVANSAFLAPAQEVTTAVHAVACVGLNALKALALTFGAFQAFRDTARCPGFDRERHQTHALLTGFIGGAMGRTPEEREELFTFGVLHDIGKLALASGLPGRYAPVLSIAADSARPVHDVERDQGLPTHAAVGAALLSLWGLPLQVVETVRHHHDTARLAAGSWGPAAAVHVADALAHEQAVAAGMEPEAGWPTVEVAMLRSLGVVDQLAEWREAAAAETQRLRLSR